MEHCIASTRYSVQLRPLPLGADPSLHEQRYLSGEIVTMLDGSQWFHPYNGGKPWQLPTPTSILHS